MKTSLFAAAAAALLAASPIVQPHPGDFGPLEGDPAPAAVRQIAEDAATAPIPTEDEVASVLAGPLAEHPGTAHVSVRDAVTGEELYGQNQDAGVAPASALKLLTAATALRTLGSERQFRTRTVLVDPARSAVHTQPQPASTWQPAAPAQPAPAATAQPAPAATAQPAPAATTQPQPSSWTPQPTPSSTWQPQPSSSWAPSSSSWTPSPSSTWQPSPSPSGTPSPTPTQSLAPTPVPTPSPSDAPAPSPTSEPSKSAEPSESGEPSKSGKPSQSPSPSSASPSEGESDGEGVPPSSSPKPSGPKQLVLVGGGDVMLGTGASDDSRVDGRAGLATLAEQTVKGLEEQGVTGEVELSLDLRLYAGDGVNPGWSEGLLEEGYISRVQPLATFGGRPQAGTAEERVADPAQFAAKRFQSVLKEKIAESGADLQLKVREDIPQTTVPREMVEESDSVGEVHSAPLREQVDYMLAHSDNQLAEALARNAAYAVGRVPDHRGAAGLMTDVAADLGVDTEGMDLKDACGLSGQNRISASALTGVLAASAEMPLLSAALEGLPRPGSDSTLSERLVGSAAEEVTAAKTGTLLESVSLTGRVVTPRGRVLVFSVVLSGIDSQVGEARAATDRAVVALAQL
ncbi:D-alanyl-D-alanine carboxypeptidase [Micrococcus lylae]|uniref:D-alanyl-D-alanine carboxypeptidase n=1 Tax=Micrococcus lylae TaxID=1273 RepID=UPI000C80B5C4|nr:D-alanyl-D-alanine carboxypeptidase [Micrococcus lylae]WIK81896.1 D-alanyl-D-alanine carboxypeptidase [Micrococcus lylae]